jgi:hypothetical protein
MLWPRFRYQHALVDARITQCLATPGCDFIALVCLFTCAIAPCLTICSLQTSTDQALARSSPRLVLALYYLKAPLPNVPTDLASTGTQKIQARLVSSHRQMSQTHQIPIWQSTKAGSFRCNPTQSDTFFSRAGIPTQHEGTGFRRQMAKWSAGLCGYKERRET